MASNRKKEREIEEVDERLHGNRQFSDILNLIVPNWYIGSIYLIFIFFLSVYVLKVRHDLNEETKTSKELNFISHERYTGVTEGEIVWVDEANSHSDRSKRIYK